MMDEGKEVGGGGGKERVNEGRKRGQREREKEERISRWEGNRAGG